MAPALGEGPERAQGPRQPRLGPDPHVCTGRARLPVRRLHAPPQQLGRPAEVADGIVCHPQVIGCLHLQGAVAERGRELEGLLARRHGAVVVSRHPEYLGHLGQHPSQPGPVVERPGQGLGLAQQGEAPPILSQCESAGAPNARRSSMASTLVSPSSGRCARAWRACSKEATASRNAARSSALAPACWQ